MYKVRADFDGIYWNENTYTIKAALDILDRLMGMSPESIYVYRPDGTVLIEYTK